MKKFLASLAAIIVLLAAAANFVTTPVATGQGRGKLIRKPQRIPNQYIVVLHDWAEKSEGRDSLTPSAAADIAAVYRGSAEKVFNHALRGFSAKLSEADAEVLAQDPRVAYVEEDAEMSLSTTQTSPPWGLDRIDQRNLPLNSQYNYTPTGAGVRAYIIDTGIRRTHTQFGGRALLGTDVIGDGQQDCNGHGTHVAGTVGGSTYGVAKGVTLYAVRVFGCGSTTSTSNIIAGVDWVTANRVLPAVANLSLGGGASTALDTAVNNLFNSGVSVSVAAGNENTNACNGSPSRVANMITVGSTTSTDARSSFSNYGTCLDLFAPGSSILSAWYTSDTATNTISGTSMASPHVAGVAALYLQNNPSASPTTVRDQIVNTATTNVLTSIGTGSPNRLLYSLLTTGGGGGGSCSGTTYTGTLSGTGDFDYHPNGSYYYSSTSGTHSGTLTGPAGQDFDLYLQKWNGSSWVIVARGETSTPNEAINYAGTSGYYRWQIYSYSGSGSYTFCLTKPS